MAIGGALLFSGTSSSQWLSIALFQYKILHLFSPGFIVFDTYLIMKKMSPEEYIVATIQLYLDIINLFIELLKILDKVNRR